MTYRKGEFGLYDCRDRTISRKIFLAFTSGLVCGVMLVVCLFFIGVCT